MERVFQTWGRGGMHVQDGNPGPCGVDVIFQAGKWKLYPRSRGELLKVEEPGMTSLELCCRKAVWQYLEDGAGWRVGRKEGIVLGGQRGLTCRCVCWASHLGGLGLIW